MAIKFYKYKFFGIDKPIVIEAHNRVSARVALEKINLPVEYANSRIVGESVVVPLLGISEKTINGKKHIWVGEKKSKTGWMEEGEYLAKIKLYKNAKRS